MVSIVSATGVVGSCQWVCSKSMWSVRRRQTRLDLPADRVGPQADTHINVSQGIHARGVAIELVLSVGGVADHAALGCQQDLVAAAFHRESHDFLGEAEAVDRGGVDQIDPRIDRGRMAFSDSASSAPPQLHPPATHVPRATTPACISDCPKDRVRMITLLSSLYTVLRV